jgi:hypothetical protein
LVDDLLNVTINGHDGDEPDNGIEEGGSSQPVTLHQCVSTVEVVTPEQIRWGKLRKKFEGIPKNPILSPCSFSRMLLH